MVGEQHPVLRGDRGEGGAHGAVQPNDDGGEGRLVRGVRIRRWPGRARRGRRGRAPSSARQARVGPEVRVRLAPRAREGEVVDPLLLGDGQVPELDQLGVVGKRLLGQPPGRLLEPQAVHVEDVRPRQQLGHAGPRLEGVRVGPLRDDPGDPRPVAGDRRDDAGDRGDGGHDAEPAVVGGLVAAGGQGQDRGQDEGEDATGPHPRRSAAWHAGQTPGIATSRSSVSR